MKLKIDLDEVSAQLKLLERESVTVGVLNDKIKAAKPDLTKPMKPFHGAKARWIWSSQPDKSKNITLRKLAFILDEKKGIFSDVLINPNNRELVQLAQDFAILDKTPDQIKQLERSARALVRNPILRKDYNPNSQLTINGLTVTNKEGQTRKIWEGKGFDHWGIATGKFFDNITAEFKKW